MGTDVNFVAQGKNFRGKEGHVRGPPAIVQRENAEPTQYILCTQCGLQPEEGASGPWPSVQGSRACASAMDGWTDGWLQGFPNCKPGPASLGRLDWCPFLLLWLSGRRTALHCRESISRLGEKRRIDGSFFLPITPLKCDDWFSAKVSLTDCRSFAPSSLPDWRPSSRTQKKRAFRDFKRHTTPPSPIC